MKKCMVVLFMIFTGDIQSKDFSFSEFSQKAINEMHAYKTSHPEEDLHVTFVGEKTLMNQCNSYVQKTALFLNNFSMQNVFLKGIASLLGATVLSYGVIAYFIYRVYSLIGRISSWLAWNTEVHEHDMVEEAKQYLARSLAQEPITRSSLGNLKQKQYLKKLKDEEKLIRLYLSLNRILKKYNIRAFFFYDENKEKQLEHALQILTTAADLCKI